MSQHMTFAEFSAANRARCEAPDGFDHKLNSWSLSDWFTAAMGELGEAANVAKKLNRVRDGIPGNKLSEAELRRMLRSEIADTFIYLDLLAQSEGFDLGEAIREAFDAKSAGIGYGFSLVAVLPEVLNELRKCRDAFIEIKEFSLLTVVGGRLCKERLAAIDAAIAKAEGSDPR